MTFLKKLMDISEYFIAASKMPDDYIRIDIKLPTNWEMVQIPEHIEVFNLEVNNGNFAGYSIYAKMDDINSTVEYIQDVEKYNIERTKKKILFDNTVKALEEVFSKHGLEKLKTLKFYFKNEKSGGKGTGDVPKTDAEKSERFGLGEGEVRQTDENNTEASNSEREEENFLG